MVFRPGKWNLKGKFQSCREQGRDLGQSSIPISHGPPHRPLDVLCVTPIPLFFQRVFIYFLINFIGVQLIYNVVLVSVVQQSESVMHTHISTLFQILFPCRSLQSIEQSFLCYTVGSYELSILYIVVYVCQSQSPDLSLPPFPVGNHKFVFYIYDSVSVL